MGKKDSNKKRRTEDEPSLSSAAYDIEADEELQAELDAVAAMRAEKARVGDDEEITHYTTYNKEGLLKHVEMSESVVLPFGETLLVDEFGCNIDNENEDLEREMAFYNQTILSVKRGRDQLEQLGVPTRRPPDYFCENMKSDMHMTKIKDKLLLEEKKIEAFEMRKNRENNRKFNKQVSELKKQEKSKKIKGEISEVSKLRKSSEDSNSKEEKLNKVLGEPMEKSKKRQIMDKKYGFGGKDRRAQKMSDKKSINDLTDFNPRGGKFVRSGGAGGGAGGRGAGRGGRGGGGGGRGSGGRGAGGRGGQRPGKDARASKRKGATGK